MSAGHKEAQKRLDPEREKLALQPYQERRLTD
ncbi:protein of unknown function [Burkholderia multivorans]